MSPQPDSDNLSEPIVFALFGRLLPVMNVLAILVLVYATFFDWNVREETRTKITVWLAAISATMVIQSLAGTISAAALEGGSILITTSWRHHRVPLDAITGVEPFNLGIQGFRFMQIRFSEQSTTRLSALIPK